MLQANDRRIVAEALATWTEGLSLAGECDCDCGDCYLTTGSVIVDEPGALKLVDALRRVGFEIREIER